MANPPQIRSQTGATHLRFGDIIVVLALLGLLLYAAWKQFPAYAPAYAPGGGQNTASQAGPQP